ncbi:MAG: CGLAU_01105 family protein [Corynebacterium sp.]|uniref:CGLAU_01105 family protein n=1 Tax=Corynebacterium sp. TaxID=1720 RepID=UPI0026DEFBD3|nr:CGLAU_01105 family protein [Corynebacterium sp.]MDO5669243.1 CGLAU_01105 family protein [Corynebacterium sp.]
MTNPNDNNNSLLDNLREPFQAWVAAGARLGDVVSDFTERYRADRERTDAPSDVHSVYSGEAATAGQESVKQRFATAAQEARTGLSGAQSTEDYKNVSLAFASRAEDIIRDIAGSVRRAAGETKSSESASEARSAFSSATASVRATFEETVEQARARRAAAGTGDEASEQSFIDDLRRRLDDLIARAGDAVDKDAETPSKNDDGEVPHMIDGEVVSSEDVPNPNKDN